MRKIYGMICLLLGVAITGQAQKIVNGTVEEASTKEALPGVTVLIKGTETGTSTTMQGNFQLPVLRDTVTLVFSSIGFEPLEKKIIITQDSTILAPIQLKPQCTIDLLYSKHVELSFLSGLRYTPLGGKIKVFYPYLIHAHHSQGALRAEFSYQLGDNNLQRNGTLALDNAFINCDNNVDVTADYQRVRLGEQGFSYIRYTIGATYTGKIVSRELPIYLAVGRLSYLTKESSEIKTGVEIGVNYPLLIHLNSARTNNLRLTITGRIAWWQDYWQFQSSVETQVKRFSVKVNFNKLGQYTEINTGIGFRIEQRYHAKR